MYPWAEAFSMLDAQIQQIPNTSEHSRFDHTMATKAMLKMQNQSLTRAKIKISSCNLHPVPSLRFVSKPFLEPP